jgi:mannose-6-phosphate isomerase-like protein (cupin superfamily)
MSDYTIVNLREVEDQAPKYGFAEKQEARFPWRDLEANSTGLAFLRVKPGKRQAFAHKHDNAEEIYVVLSGSGRVKLGDEVLEVKAMDAIRVAPKIIRQFEAGDEGLELLAFGPRHEKDGEIIREGFWD